MRATKTIKVNGKVETVVDSYSDGPGTEVHEFVLLRGRSVRSAGGRWFYTDHTTRFICEHGFGIEVAIEK
jgi:hypothetical protein